MTARKPWNQPYQTQKGGGIMKIPNPRCIVDYQKPIETPAFTRPHQHCCVSSLKIREQTGHVSETMLARYIWAEELFTNNAAGALL